MLQRFDVVLVPFPFVDGDNVKARPAIVLALGERHGDVLLMFISSRTEMPAAFDELDLLSSEAGFEQTGLKVSSRARISRLVTLSNSLVKRRIGHLPEGIQQQLRNRIVEVIAAP
ncbi:MAG: type II toxin-antitoxin system PemK/MazF family toxin [Cyanobium sp. CZS 25K]|nr:type II toxin-antitoxin system PemK/MazF family toxin [Cyanobium sp. CZS25K]